MQIHANNKEILSGKTTDIYFRRAEEILKKEKKIFMLHNSHRLGSFSRDDIYSEKKPIF